MTATPVAPPTVADERATLEAFLDQARSSVRCRCAGLLAVDQRVAHIVAHLRWVEAKWFEGALRGEKICAPHPDSDDPTGLADLLDEYDDQCSRSREICRTLSLDTAVYDEGVRFSVRWILFHVLAETERHIGQLETVLGLLTAA